MITTLAKTIFLSMLAAVVSWGWVLRNPPRPAYLEEETLRAAGVVRDEGLLTGLSIHALRASALVDRLLPKRTPEYLAAHLRQGAGVSAVHMALLCASLPGALLALAGGVAFGLWRRERIRHGETYASPTLGLMAKHLLVGGAVFIFVFATSPLGIPYRTVPVALLGMVLSSSVYVANLPLKL